MTRSPDLSVLVVPIGNVRANSWNPNRQDAFIFEKEKASITEFGFLVPIIARKVKNDYEVIDGEHRLRAATELGYKDIPLIDIGPLDDDTAKQLTIILNETKGQAQPDLLRTLLADLMSRKPKEDLLAVLPYTPMQFDSLVSPFDWGKIERPVPVQERWVMRSYRMPADAAEVLDAAISKVQAQESCADWQAIEMIAAEFIAGE